MNKGGKGLIQRSYNGSISLALSTVYPEYNWLPWLVEKVSNSEEFWEEPANQRKALDYLGQSTYISEGGDPSSIHKNNNKKNASKGKGSMAKNNKLERTGSYITQQQDWYRIRVQGAYLKWIYILIFIHFFPIPILNDLISYVLID